MPRDARSNGEVKTSMVRELRRRWRPHKERLNRARHPLPIRMHRALSWFDQAEKLDVFANAEQTTSNGKSTKDDDSILILRWIALNALYGRWDSATGEPEPDRQSIRRFLTKLFKLDEEQRIAAALQKHRPLIEKICTDKYVHQFFWRSLESDQSYNPHKSKRDLERQYRDKKWSRILNALIERIYLVRCQLIHGAATHGGSLNRDVVRRCGEILNCLLVPMIQVMIDHGLTDDWGDLCYPPLNELDQQPPPKKPR